ncbi:MAG: glycosyltransferase [bacterium]
MDAPRVLVTVYPQVGHLHPLIPTARALADAGCRVLVAISARQHAPLAAAGLEAVDLGPSQDEVSPRVREVMPALLAAAPAARRAIAFSFLFGHVYAAAIAEDLLACAREWRADVVFAGLESLAGPLVAAQIDRPLVVSSFGTGLGQDVREASALAVAPLWERAGLGVAVAAGLFDGLLVDPCPPSLRPDDVAVGARSQRVRPAQYDGIGALPPLPAQRPLVYITFGTNPHFATAQRLQAIAQAISAVGAGAVITGVDRDAIGPLPDGVVAHAFVPQSALLPSCDVVLCHGGASTLFGALASGLPLLVMPLGADHFANAAAAARRGVAVVLDADANVQAVETGLRRVLTDGGMRRAAQVVADEIVAMPSPAAAADGILAWLARGDRAPHVT